MSDNAGETIFKTANTKLYFHIVTWLSVDNVKHWWVKSKNRIKKFEWLRSYKFLSWRFYL